jgi:hypothetical protein
MNLFVKWDSDNNKILYGPQGVAGDGDGWYPLIETGEVENYRTQHRVYEFVEAVQAVIGRVEGSANLTWIQARQGAYGGLADQLDMIWHDMNDGTFDSTGLFFNHIKDIKDANPKG